MALKIQTKIPNESNCAWYDKHILMMYRSMYDTMTAESALDAALKAEEGFKDSCIFSTVYLELKMKSECLFDYARLLEKEDKESLAAK